MPLTVPAGLWISLKACDVTGMKMGLLRRSLLVTLKDLYPIGLVIIKSKIILLESIFASDYYTTTQVRRKCSISPIIFFGKSGNPWPSFKPKMLVHISGYLLIAWSRTSVSSEWMEKCVTPSAEASRAWSIIFVCASSWLLWKCLKSLGLALHSVPMPQKSSFQ